MSHPSGGDAASSPQVEPCGKPLLEERCHGVTEWWHNIDLQDGRPMIAPTELERGTSRAPSTTKYKNAQKKHRRIGGVKNIYILGGVNVLNGGVITTIKDVIYI